MPWGAVAGAVVGSVANKALNKEKNGGAGASTATKEPWDAAAPWLKDILAGGQDLYAQYQSQPFNAQQRQAYTNSYALSDYARELVPSLLGQLQAQPVGFDPSNPSAKAKAWDWSQGLDLLTGAGRGSMGNAQAAQDAADAAKPAAAAPAGWAWDGKFHSQDDVLSGLNFTGHDSAGNLVGTGGFGSWQYGAGALPGTDQWRDRAEYFLRGGADPNNVRAAIEQSQYPLVAAFQNAGGS